MTELEKIRTALQIAIAQRNKAQDDYLGAMVELNVAKAELAKAQAPAPLKVVEGEAA